MDHELALVMIKLQYADLTWGQFADKFDLKLNPSDRDFLVGDCEFCIFPSDVDVDLYLHVIGSCNVLIGFESVLGWYSCAAANRIKHKTMKQILTFEDKI